MLPVRRQVRIASLADFGALDQVGERLLGAERAKESTLSVAMVEAEERDAAAGPLYDFCYELESTRGRKLVFSTVTIVGGQLYIANATLGCGEGGCGGADATGGAALLRAATRSLRVRQ